MIDECTQLKFERIAEVKATYKAQEGKEEERDAEIKRVTEETTKLKKEKVEACKKELEDQKKTL